jgi:hypothetical protein
MSPRLIVAILDARIGPFTPGMIGRLSTATGAPVATIKKAWELKAIESKRRNAQLTMSSQVVDALLCQGWAYHGGWLCADSSCYSYE